MMHLSSNRLSLEQHLLSSELIIQLLCFPSRCLVEFSRILIKTHFQTPWMLISSKEIKTISTINIKLQLSHQAAAGSQPRQVMAMSCCCPDVLTWKPALSTYQWPAQDFLVRMAILHRYCTVQSPWMLHVSSETLPEGDVLPSWAQTCLSVPFGFHLSRKTPPWPAHPSWPPGQRWLFWSFYFPALFCSTGFFFSLSKYFPLGKQNGNGPTLDIKRWLLYSQTVCKKHTANAVAADVLEKFPFQMS